MEVLDSRYYSGMENHYAHPFAKYWKHVLSQNSRGRVCGRVLLPSYQAQRK